MNRIKSLPYSMLHLYGLNKTSPCCSVFSFDQEGGRELKGGGDFLKGKREGGGKRGIFKGREKFAPSSHTLANLVRFIELGLWESK